MLTPKFPIPIKAHELSLMPDSLSPSVSLTLPPLLAPLPQVDASTFGRCPSLLLHHTSSPPPPATAGALPTGHRLDLDLPRGDRVVVAANNEHATRGD